MGKISSFFHRFLVVFPFYLGLDISLLSSQISKTISPISSGCVYPATCMVACTGCHRDTCPCYFRVSLSNLKFSLSKKKKKPQIFQIWRFFVTAWNLNRFFKRRSLCFPSLSTHSCKNYQFFFFSGVCKPICVSLPVYNPHRWLLLCIFVLNELSYMYVVFWT